MAGGGGGAWKVAYADFVTAMMAFFMVMWLVGQDDKKKEAISDYFKDPWATSQSPYNRSRNPTLGEPRSGQTDPKKKFSGSNPSAMPHDAPEATERKKPKLVTVRAPERTTAGTIVHFELSHTDLSDEAKMKLDGVLSSFIGLSHKIDIRGHVSPSMNFVTAEDPLWHIAYQRCIVVMHYLTELGIEPERIRLSVAGPFEPLVLNTQDSSKDQNARVEVFLLSETVSKFQGSAKDIAESVIEEYSASDSIHQDSPPPDAQGQGSAHGNTHDKGNTH